MTQDTTVRIAKLAAAERQLDQAIRLFFARDDEVSVHTLSAASYQIISDICKHKKIEREIEDSAILTQFGIKAEVLRAIRKPQNFFKHAENDHEESVELNPMLTVCLMMSAVQYLLKLRTVQTLECQLFRYWFFLKMPEKTPIELKSLLAANPVPPDPDDYAFFVKLIAYMKQRVVSSHHAA